MSSLPLERYLQRLGLDYRAFQTFESRDVGSFAYRSHEDAKAGRKISTKAGMSGKAEVYDILIRVPLPVDEKRTVAKTRLRIDIGAAGTAYPDLPPRVECLTRPIPFSAHVYEDGTVCVGEAWEEARGDMLAADLALDIVRALNFAEPDRGSGYRGWSEDALRYWREELGGRPFNPDFEYPERPPWVSEIVPERSGFRRVNPPARFDAPAPAFRRIG